MTKTFEDFEKCFFHLIDFNEETWDGLKDHDNYWKSGVDFNCGHSLLSTELKGLKSSEQYFKPPKRDVTFKNSNTTFS